MYIDTDRIASSDDIKDLEYRIENLQKISEIVLKLLEYRGHLETCPEFINSHINIMSVKHTGYLKLRCYCKNKVTHNVKCKDSLVYQFKRLCDCGINELKVLINGEW